MNRNEEPVQGDYQKALFDLDAAIYADPNYAEAYNGDGLVYSDQGDTEQALANFNRAIYLQPSRLQHHITTVGLSIPKRANLSWRSPISTRLSNLNLNPAKGRF